ncbi:MAG: DUF3788 family protein [Candidatus Heimdallarchaeota archaeon]
MSTKEEFTRMIEKEPEPSDNDLLNHMSKEAQAAWLDIRSFVEENYTFEPNIVYWEKKIGWGLKYQRSGRTLVSFYPEKNCFAVLLTLGKKEVEAFELIKNEFTPYIVDVFENTKQLHDGRWLWLRVSKITETPDIKRLIIIKKKPKKK